MHLTASSSRNTCAYILAVLAFGFMSAVPYVARAADGALFVRPERANYTVGQQFDVQVLVDTDGTPVNAVEAELAFDPRDLVVERVSTEGSILASWPTPPQFSNTDGSITFSGWAEEPYDGPGGLLATVTFRALRTVSSGARLAAGAALAAHGGEENIITSMRSAAFTIRPQEIVPTAPAEQSTPALPVTASRQPEEPALIEYETIIEAGERIVMKGIGRPGARIVVWLARGDDPPSQTSILAAADGSFTFVSDNEATAGVYRLWAVEDVPSAPSSRQLRITVRERPFAAAAATTGGLLFASVPYVALVIAAGFLVAFMRHRRA